MASWRRRGTLAATIAAAVVIPALPAQAASGDLDVTFGSGGKVTTDFGATPSQPDTGNALAVQADGKIVVAGRASFNLPGFGGTAEFALARYNTNGSLDTSFDGDGKVTTAFFAPPNTQFARAIAIQSADGKILAAGLAGPNEQTASIAIARYNPDGSLDTSFDGDGKKIFNASDGVGNGLRGIHVRGNGKIVSVGAAGPSSIVVQLNSDGSFDPSFGGGDGIEVVEFGMSSSHLFASHLRGDGKLYVVGFGIDIGLSGYLLARLNLDGSLDTSFGGGDGVVVTHLSTTTHDIAFGVTTTNQGTRGKIVLTGAASSNEPFNVSGDTRFGVVRHNADGSLDTSFDGDGIAVTKVSTTQRVDQGRAVAVHPDGTVVTAGLSNATSAFPLDPVDGEWTAIRYNSSGTLDSTFGANGIVTTPFSGGGDAARGLAIDTIGRIVAAGTATVTQPDGTQGLDFAVTRYLG